jgi:hypothetical protein
MTPTFVDTSAILALRSPRDDFHTEAVATFGRLQKREAPLLTTSYVLVETYALLRGRLGQEAVRAFRDHLEPLLDVAWIDRGVHEEGLDIVVKAGRRGPSLVDATAFIVARRRGITEAFAFDPHFAAAGLEPVH